METNCQTKDKYVTERRMQRITTRRKDQVVERRLAGKYVDVTEADSGKGYQRRFIRL